MQVGPGVKTAAVYRITQQGNLNSTQNTFDLAIQGSGYFQITLPSGDTAYTRAGSFQLSASGQLVTADGDIVLPAITIPNNAVDITINASGQVLVKIAGTVTPQNVGQLQLANFPNAAGLAAVGGNHRHQPVTALLDERRMGCRLDGRGAAADIERATRVHSVKSSQRGSSGRSSARRENIWPTYFRMSASRWMRST